MGNSDSKYRIPSNLFKNEHYTKAEFNQNEILKRSGLDLGKEIQINKVHVDEDVVINSFKIGNNTDSNKLKEKIVLIHGYMSFGASYYRMLQNLSKNYEIYALDLPGMGLSSRPEFPYQNQQDSIDFFLNSLDKFMVNQEINKFTLVGHSFGGYVSGQYAKKHPEKVNNLILLSPLGVTSRTTEEMEIQDQENMKKASTFRKLVFTYLRFSFKQGHTLQTVANQFFVPTQWFLRKWTSYWFPCEDHAEDKEYFFNYLNSLLKLPTSSDKALTTMFHLQKLTAKEPLESALKDVPVNTHFYFGDRDWMCQVGAQRMKMNNAEKSFNVVKNAGHNLQLDQPEYLCEQLVNIQQKQKQKLKQ